MLHPMLAAEPSATLIVLIVFVSIVSVIAIPVAGIVAIVYFINRRAKIPPPSTSQTPRTPFPAAPAATPAAQPTVKISTTAVMPHKCPQCGTILAHDAPEGLCPTCLLKGGIGTEASGASAPASFVPPSIAELAPLFPQLEIQQCLGRGGMGAVYKARHPRLDRFVALKILAPEKQGDPQFAERFEREARVLAKLSHPNIVSVFDFGEVQGRYYLIMEFVDGLTLRQVIQAGKMSPDEALALVPRICEALQYAHEHGIVHRDIKPENILMDKQGRVKIADFGIAKIAGMDATGLSLTGARDVMGTPHYMAPEQVEKPRTVDHRADIYSLGVVFYEMLTGELPLGKFAPPSKKVAVDVRLDEVVLQALEKEPARRYQQASQVKTAVETIAGTPGSFSSPVPVLPANSALITAPAVALMIAGLWKILSAFLNMAFFLPGANQWLDDLIGMDVFKGWGTTIAASTVLFKLVPGALIAFGGYQMLERRSYAWSVAAGILGVIACSFVSLPIGIWALIVLVREDVKAAFGLPHAATAPLMPKPDRFWRRFAVIIASIILVPTAIVIILVLTAISIPAWVKASTKANALTEQEMKSEGIRKDHGEYRKDSSQTFPLSTNGEFKINNVNGRVDIQGWASNMVAITAAIHGKSAAGVKAARINIDSKPDSAFIDTKIPENGPFHWSWDWFKNLSRDNVVVDYTIHVPEGVSLKNVNNVNGRVEIAGVSGAITASTVNGEANIHDAVQNLKLDSVNGAITAYLNRLGEGQNVSFHAVNGRIKLLLPDDADASFSLHTLNGGISSDFPELKPKKEFPIGSSLKNSIGGGRAQVKGDTVNGAIDIERLPVMPATSTTVTNFLSSPKAR